MKNKVPYILFVVLIIYHILLKASWTPLLYYSGTYLMLIWLLWDKRKAKKKEYFIRAKYDNKINKGMYKNFGLLIIYFSLIFVYVVTNMKANVAEFYKAISIREIALGFGGIAIIILMATRREG